MFKDTGVEMTQQEQITDAHNDWLSTDPAEIMEHREIMQEYIERKIDDEMSEARDE
jgi:hypothetical protein